MDRILPFSKKGDLGITKNFRGITITTIAVKVYIISWVSIVFNLKLRNSQEKKSQFSEKSIHSFSDSDYSSNH